MKIFRTILLFIVATLCSCDFDHLHYETNLLALVRVDVDWSRSHISPNGVSAFVYDAKGKLHCKQLSSNPNVVYLKLPAGKFTVVLHNNDITEIGGVTLSEMNHLESAAIYATERKDEPSFNVVVGDMLFVNEPDDVVSCTLRDIEISQSDIEYHYYKPDIADYEQQVAHIYNATPLHIVHLSRVIVHIDGLEFAMGAPTAVLKGMSGGYSFDKETTTPGDVIEQFKVNTRVSKADDEGDDTIFVDYNTFGMHATDPETRRYYLEMRFKLIDGSYKDYNIDVTDDIRTEPTQTQNRHIIEVKLEELPEVEGGENPDGGSEEGVYDPSVDDWLDVNVELPM